MGTTHNVPAPERYLTQPVNPHIGHHGIGVTFGGFNKLGFALQRLTRLGFAGRRVFADATCDLIERVQRQSLARCSAHLRLRGYGNRCYRWRPWIDGRDRCR